MIFKRPLLSLSAVALALAACTSPDMATDDSRQRTKEGAVLGGLLGGMAGLLSSGDSGERTRAALGGAVLGAGVGAAIGYSLDQQAEELRRDFGDDRIRIINNGDHLVVRMPQDILFDVDSTYVKPGLRGDLNVLANSLQKYPGSTVEVIGHTDSDGTAAYNLDLSQRRANSVASILISAGVAASRLNAYGRGEDDPIATNLTAEGKAQNRRVEIIIRPTS